VLIADVDRFKVVNDCLGYDAGDEVLLAVARRLRTCVVPGSTLARFGGDEFAILLDEGGETEAAAMAARMQAAMGPPLRIGERDLRASLSIGVAVAPGRVKEDDDLLPLADIALHQAKCRGGGHTQVYDPASGDKALERLGLEIALWEALDNAQLEVHYQPVICLESGDITGFEALVRWNHPVRGQMLPDDFIPMAEETELILPLGRWVLHEACRQMVSWQESGSSRRPLVMSVNLSCRQLRDPGLVDDVVDILRQTGLAAEHLCLEITETAILEETATTAANMAALKALGVRLAIDDFGTGYASLRYLKRIPVDVVKIDKSFTLGMGEHRVDSEIVRAIVHLARATGATAVAEGVETAAQLRWLQAAGCGMGQGFHLARPQPASDVDLLLSSLTERASVA
jgi:diguanylate cyclase (GGDEF)-like protein